MVNGGFPTDYKFTQFALQYLMFRFHCACICDEFAGDKKAVLKSNVKRKQD